MKMFQHEKLSMTFFFSSIVFVVIFFTTMIMGSIFVLLVRLGLISSMQGAGIILLPIALTFVSNVVGVLVTLIISRIPLAPVREIMAATEKLASGDFKTRMHIGGPREFQELNASFNRMAEELDSIEMLRSDFINNFSHEFKTPIVSLRGYAKLLKAENLSKEERDEYLDIIIRESDRLASLATNVLNLSKVENQTILSEVAPFDLTEQIRQVIVGLEPKWSEKGLDIELDLDECQYTGNEALLYQVWLNLIDNAIKFTPQNGKIEIKLVGSKKAHIFSVKDTGCGIDQTTQQHMFNKFYQGDTSHTTEGNGLGLTLCKKIIALHQGSIHVTSKLERGTTFSVELPNA